MKILLWSNIAGKFIMSDNARKVRYTSYLGYASTFDSKKEAEEFVEKYCPQEHIVYLQNI